LGSAFAPSGTRIERRPLNRVRTRSRPFEVLGAVEVLEVADDPMHFVRKLVRRRPLGEDSEVDRKDFLPVYSNLPRASFISKKENVIHPLVEAAKGRNQELDHFAHVWGRLGFDAREHAREQPIEVRDEVVDAVGMQIEIR